MSTIQNKWDSMNEYGYYDEENYDEENYEKKIMRLNNRMEIEDEPVPTIRSPQDAVEILMTNIFAKKETGVCMDEIEESLNYLCDYHGLKDVKDYCSLKSFNIVSLMQLHMIENLYKDKIRLIKDFLKLQVKRLCREVYGDDDFDVEALDSVISDLAFECDFDMTSNRKIKLEKIG